MQHVIGLRTRKTGRKVLGAAVTLVAIAGLFVVASATPAAAAACDTSWASAVSGNWTDVTKWTAGVPTSGTNACITKPGTYTVHLLGVQSAASLTLGGTTGTQALSIEGDCTAGNAELHLSAASTVKAHGLLVLTDGGCGYAWLDQQTGTLSNAGTIRTDAGTGTTRYFYGDTTNSGTVTINASLLTNSAHLFTNTGSVTIATGATWTETNSFSNVSGSLSTAGTGAFLMSFATFTQGAGTVSGSITMVGGSLAYTGGGAGTITTLGVVLISGNTVAGQTIAVTGDCTLGGNAQLYAVASRTNGGLIILTETGCGYAWLDQQAGTLTNTGTIRVDVGTGLARYLYGNTANSGTLTINASLQTNTGSLFTNTGTVTVATGTTWSMNNSFSNVSGSLSITGTGTFLMTGATFTQGAGTTTGSVSVVSGSLIYTGGGAGTITSLGSVALSGNTVAGQTIAVTGDCSFGGNAHLYAVASWTNGGVVILTDTGCGYAWLDQQAGTLTNTGTIRVDVGTGGQRYLYGTVLNSGLFEMGAGTLTTTSAGSITNAAAGTFRTDILSASSFGAMNGTSPVIRGGTFAIVTDPGYTPTLNTAFTIVTCGGGCSGTFATITGQPITGGLGYKVSATSAVVKLTVKKAADLSVTGSAPATVSSGSTFSYTFTVLNSGPNTATAVKLTDTLPAGVTFSSASAGCSIVGTKVTCLLGNLTNGASTIVTITVVAGAPGVVNNTGTATASTVDFTPANAKKKVKVTVT